MLQTLQVLLAPLANYELYKAGKFVLVGLIVACAIAAIICVLMQSGNSEGVSAITGSSETFYSKNKGRSKESILKIITVVCLVAIAVCSVGYFLLELLV